LNNTPSDGQLR